jgi:hypothetical protein
LCEGIEEVLSWRNHAAASRALAGGFLALPIYLLPATGRTVRGLIVRALLRQRLRASAATVGRAGRTALTPTTP